MRTTFPNNNNILRGHCSNVKHMEEIRTAGYELPAVNQIEVGFIISFKKCSTRVNPPCHPYSSTHFVNKKKSLSTAKPTISSYRRIALLFVARWTILSSKRWLRRYALTTFSNLDIVLTTHWAQSTPVTQLKFYVGGRYKKGAF